MSDQHQESRPVRKFNDRKSAAPRKENERRYGKPAPHADGERRYGKPAPHADGERRYGKPAPHADGERRFGKPAPHADGERRYGKPAPRADGERRYGKPAPHTDGERRYGKPAPRADGERRYGKPAPRADGERRYGKPAPRADGERRFGKPAPHADGERRYGKPAPVNDGLAARRAAYRVLCEVTENGAYAALALDRQLTRSGLSTADRHLAASLVYDTLDNQMRLDWALSKFLQKEDTEPKLRIILRLGACQILLYDKIPESAAVNTAVSLCKDAGLEGLSGVCNAILRNLIRGRDEIVYPDETQEPEKFLSVMFSVPEWLVRQLIADYGYPTAKAIVSYRQREAGATLRPNLMQLDHAAFKKLLNSKVWKWEKGQAPDAYIVHGAADLAQDADFQSGRFSIQSESSMFAALALTVRPGMQVLDVCAAPGGKTCYLAERMNGTGRVQSWDLHPHRVRLIEAQARRLHLDNVRPMARDATALRDELVQTMDAVLLDAPCSGTGVMAGKPDVKYRVTAEGVAELAETQRKLLDTCCQYVKRGGQFVYSTCSLLPEENAQQLHAFLERHPEFELLPLPETFPAHLRDHAGADGLQILPCRDGLDGFFIALMRRKA